MNSFGGWVFVVDVMRDCRVTNSIRMGGINHIQVTFSKRRKNVALRMIDDLKPI